VDAAADENQENDEQEPASSNILKRPASAMEGSDVEEAADTGDKPVYKRFRIVLPDGAWAFPENEYDDEGEDEGEDDGEDESEHEGEDEGEDEEDESEAEDQPQKRVHVRRKRKLAKRAQNAVTAASARRSSGLSAKRMSRNELQAQINPSDASGSVFRMKVGVYSFDLIRRGFRNLGSAQAKDEDLESMSALYNAMAQKKNFTYPGALGGKILLDEGPAERSDTSICIVASADDFKLFLSDQKKRRSAGQTSGPTSLYVVLCYKPDQRFIKDVLRTDGFQNI
jgi:hypothetical protein